MCGRLFSNACSEVIHTDGRARVRRNCGDPLGVDTEVGVGALDHRPFLLSCPAMVRRAGRSSLVATWRTVKVFLRCEI